MLNGDNNEVANAAVRICKGYLNGPWKKITPEDVTVKSLSGGLSNWLFQVKLEKEEAKPQQVLIRLYGQTHGEGALENLITESVIFTLLSERKLGPKLYGVFPGGRIEEFIPARPLTQQEMADPTLNLIVAEKMAAVHTMNIPINKEPRWLWDTMNKWLMNIDEQPPVTDVQRDIFSRNLKTEALWLRNHLSKIYSPVVFCHNDLQQGNILRREDQPKHSSTGLVLIDFEYCSYNFRGFDLANHFIEWMYDYTNPEYPHYHVNKKNYCSVEQMQKFIEKYLSSLNANGGIGKPEVNNVSAIMREISHYSLASHFFWGIWSIVNARVSKIPFGYWDYAQERLSTYYKLKAELVEGSKENSAVKRKVKDVD
uniref:Choline kinase n=3 Tax=Rhodnius TaxID=13248 RepID=T1HFI9_RHOPR